MCKGFTLVLLALTGCSAAVSALPEPAAEAVAAEPPAVAPAAVSSEYQPWQGPPMAPTAWQITVGGNTVTLTGGPNAWMAGPAVQAIRAEDYAGRPHGPWLISLTNGGATMTVQTPHGVATGIPAGPATGVPLVRAAPWSGTTVTSATITPVP